MRFALALIQNSNTPINVDQLCSILELQVPAQGTDIANFISAELAKLDSEAPELKEEEGEEEE